MKLTDSHIIHLYIALGVLRAWIQMPRTAPSPAKDAALCLLCAEWKNKVTLPAGLLSDQAVQQYGLRRKHSHNPLLDILYDPIRERMDEMQLLSMACKYHSPLSFRTSLTMYTVSSYSLLIGYLHTTHQPFRYDR